MPRTAPLLRHRRWIAHLAVVLLSLTAALTGSGIPASATAAPAPTPAPASASASDPQWVGVGPRGAGWTDYTVDTDFLIVNEAADVYFRADGAGNSYMWEVNISGSVPVFKPHVRVAGGYRVLKEVPIGDVIAPDALHSVHHLRISARGSTIVTSVDGVQVDTMTDPTRASGTVGFRASNTEDAFYSNLTVTAPDGSTLFADPLTTGGRNEFTAGTPTATGLEVSGADALLTPGNGTTRLRHEFAVGKKVRSARLSASALGIYQLDIDGKQVGDQLFAPGWTDYSNQIQYQTYDVTGLVARGGNAIAAQLAPGWYAGNVGWFGTGQYGSSPALWARLEISYTDGTVQQVVTDLTWSASTTGPVTGADNYMGESYDARAEQPGWDRPGFHGAGWQAVDVLPSQTDKLVSTLGPPVRVTGTVRPVRITRPAAGTYIVDLGQEITGVTRLRVRGAAGDTVTLRHAQALNPDGTLYTKNLAAGPQPYVYARQTDTYTLSGRGTEVFQPQFTEHGFRYVEVTGYPGPLTAADVTGVVEGSDAPVIGSFATSDPLLNKLQSNITWSERDNLFSVPLSDDARSERLGWTGDAEFFAPTAVFNRDLDGFYRKWERDLIDSQTSSGVFDNVAPTWPPVANAGYGGGWGDAGIVIPYTAWQNYGDTAIVRDSYPAMRKYVTAMTSMSSGLILPASFAPAGDWMNVGQGTPADLIATAYFAYDTSLLADMADAIGNTADAAAYRDLFTRISAAWQAKYLAADGTIAGDSQTAYVVALKTGLLPESRRAAAASRLVSLIQAAGDHLTSGFVGTQWLLPVLSDTGHTDVAYRLIEQTDYPSWGYEIAKGATTTWERWDAIGADGSFNPNENGNGFDLPVGGTVGTWMYRTILGIVPDPDQPGYRHFSIRPQPGGGLTHAAGSLKSPYGTIAASWSRRDGGLTLSVKVPPHTTATVVVPAAHGVSAPSGARLLRRDNSGSQYAVGSGSYAFTSR